MPEVNQGGQVWLNRSMKAVILAQFFSAFGDNALLFATLALIKQQHYPEWSQPLLQMVFVAAYIIFAPFVGQLADSFSKARVMLAANSVKLVSTLLICFGFNPFMGYTLIGLGATVYSPAKYGILGEITDGKCLIHANGLMEASTIVAILAGSIAGGLLADWHILAALILCVMVYGIALVANCYIPHLNPVKSVSSWHPKQMVSTFFYACKVLWKNQQARFSLIGTSLFWGVGVTLRFLLVLWVPLVFNITDNTTPTLLNAMVAVGIIIGAAAAGKWVTPRRIMWCMPAGIFVGIIVAYFSIQSSLFLSYLLLALLGVCGGFFVVPLNALLQMSGRESVGVGKSISVQNLGENSAMLLMLTLYSIAVKLAVSAIVIGATFGVSFALLIFLIWLSSYKRCRV